MKIKSSLLILFLIFLSLVFVVLGPLQRADAFQGVNEQVAETIIPESSDYATLILRDPWDMKEFSDISQYLNQSGQVSVVKNISVNNGVFSATSVGSVFTGQNGWFHLLFPGYETAVHLGKTGSRYPIDSSDFACFYIAAKINSGPNRDASGGGPDQHRIFWFANDRLNSDPNGYGFSAGIQNYPEFVGIGIQPNPYWKLIKIDLRSVTNIGPVPWNSRSEWQGIRFEPTIQEDVSYEVDWARLTNCASNNVQVSFQPDQNIKSVWLTPVGTSRNILMSQDVNGNSGSYSLDIQGVTPGRYYVNFGTGSGTNTAPTCCLQTSRQPIEINQSPVANYFSPGFYSGLDYGTFQGNAWDFSSEKSISDLRCVDYSLTSSNTLWINTAPPNLQPAECLGSNNIPDPSIYLPVSNSIDTSQYRYLTYHFSTNNEWQNVPQGMIVRLIWSVQGTSGRSDYECHLVSQDLPFDVGWQTYTVDLWDAFAGSVEEMAGECSSSYSTWLNSPPVLKLQFNPNENITSGYISQELDWIRLTKAAQAVRGAFYPIQISLNKSPDTIKRVDFFFTDDINFPTRYSLVGYSPTFTSLISENENNVTTTESSLSGTNRIYLPSVVKNYQKLVSPPSVENEILYWWDTSNVSYGEYYPCAVVFDGYNQTTFCSEAPVKIVP